MQQLCVLCLLIGTLVQVGQTILPPPFRDARPPPRIRSGHFTPSQNDIERAIELATRFTDFLERFENTILWPSRIEPGTPTHGLFLAHEPQWKAIERGREALLAMKASAQMAYSCCHERGLSLEVCSDILRHSNFYRSSLNETCSYLQRKCTHEEVFSKYRSIDGTCNHANKGSTGESFTAHERLLQATYMNDYEAPKRSVTKTPMPSPRKLSSELVSHRENPHESITLAFTLFGQFIEHDLSSFGTSVMIHLNDSFSCCDISGYDMAPRYKHPLCMSIPIPSDDPYYSKKRVECMSYARSLPAMRSDCSMGYIEQQNQATHYLDGSQIYGTTVEKSLELRSKQNGKLYTNEKGFLSLSIDPRDQCQVDSENDVCFVSGDPRINLHPQLTVMYTLWAREHNRIAEELAKMNTEWDDEQLYQQSRRIVIAEMQHITYHEWLKHLLGKPHLDLLGKFSKYHKETDPSVSNEFATAAVRSLYSMFPGNISMVDENRTETSVLKMREHFNRPEVVTKDETFDLLLRGLASQQAHKIGMNFSEDLTNQFLADENYGYDLLSLDIQRGRDHGLPGYNSYRRLCGLHKATKFSDFSNVMSQENIGAISKQYQHVDDVDLLVGGLLEKPERNSLLGPTFSCIIADQFMRTRRGDRYFYSSPQQPTPFSVLQLAEIKNATLARIFCDNSNIEMIQPKVFEKISDRNQLVNCTNNSIPRLDLRPWQAARKNCTEVKA